MPGLKSSIAASTISLSVQTTRSFFHVVPEELRQVGTISAGPDFFTVRVKISNLEIFNKGPRSWSVHEIIEVSHFMEEASSSVVPIFQIVLERAGLLHCQIGCIFEILQREETVAKSNLR